MCHPKAHKFLMLYIHLGKVTALGELCCFALFFLLISHLNMYIPTKRYSYEVYN